MSQTLDRVKALIDKFDNEKNEELFPLCATQVALLYAREPAPLHAFLFNLFKRLLVSKQAFQRILAASLFERIADQMWEHQASDDFFFPESTLHFDIQAFIDSLEKSKREKTKNEANYDRFVQLDVFGTSQDNIIKFLSKKENYLFSKSEKSIQAKEKASKLKLSEEGEEEYIEQINQRIERDENLEFITKDGKGPTKKVKPSILDNMSPEEDTASENPRGSQLTSLFDAVFGIARYLVFHVNWELRHGALLIFRVVSRKFGKILSLMGGQKPEARLSIERDSDKRVARLNGKTLEEISRYINEDMKQKCVVLLALDRFSDFLGDRSSMTHRALGGEILVTLFVNLPNVELFYFIFEFLFLPNRRYDWEPKQAFIFLLKKLLEKDTEIQLSHGHSPTPVVAGHSSLRPTKHVHRWEPGKSLLDKKFVESISKQILEIFPEHEEICEISSQFCTALAQSRFWPPTPEYPEAFQRKLIQKMREIDDIGYLPKPVFELFSLMLIQRQLSPQLLLSLEELLRKFIFHDNQEVRLEIFTFISNLLSFWIDQLTQSNLEFIYVAVVFHYLSRKELVLLQESTEEAFAKEASHIVGILRSILGHMKSQPQMFELIAILFQVLERQDFKSVVQTLRVTFSYNIERQLTFRNLDIIELIIRLLQGLEPARLADLYRYLLPKSAQNSLVLCPFMLTPETAFVVGEDLVTKFLVAEPASLDLTYLSDSIGVAMTELDHFLCNQMADLPLDKAPALERLVLDILSKLEDTANHKSHVKDLLKALADTEKTILSLMEQEVISFTKSNLIMLLQRKLVPMFRGIHEFSQECVLVLKCSAAVAYLNRQSEVISQRRLDETEADREDAKPLINNNVIAPLLTNLDQPLPSFFADMFSGAIYRLVEIYKGRARHPNHIVIAKILKSAAKDPVFASNIRGYFTRLFAEFSWMAVDQFPNLEELFKNERLFAEFVQILVGVRDLEGKIAFSGRFMALLAAERELDRPSLHVLVVHFFEAMVARMNEGDAEALDHFLSWFLTQIRLRRLEAFLAMKALLEKSKKAFVPFSKIFLQETIRSINEAFEGDKSPIFDVFSMMLSLSHFDVAVPGLRLLSPELQGLYEDGRRFLFEFKNPNNFDIDLEPVLNHSLNKFALRDYQIEGIKWVSFLFRYGLSGSLCDDMGLGKTLQSLCAVALVHHQAPKGTRPMSLVVCPNTLMTHWVRECQQFIAAHVLRPVAILASSLNEGLTMSQLADQSSPNTLFVVSYNTLNRVRDFMDFKFAAVVVDEAHLIRNPKSKTSQAVRQLNSRLRLALTGTPIQNKITELWAIFDFLLPMYLGRNDEFNKEFRSLLEMSLLTIDLSKMHLSESQQALLSALHRKVLPFIMRREKSDVLKDLPDKIIQDFYCEMGDAQAVLYAQFHRDFQPPDDSEQPPTEEELAKKSFFTVLSQMRKVLNHPSLLEEKGAKPDKKKRKPRKTDAKESQGEDLGGTLLGKRRDPDQPALEAPTETGPLGFFEQSGKFVGLRELLRSLDFAEEDVLACSGNPNKMLLFTRSNDTLDLLQSFFRETFPFLKFLTLHKTQTQFQRAEVVDQFNRERDCKALLLTPKIGGLGLNLHSANIVVMFDHDFNPMNDLQAMDRAHRLGQKNVVNVFRMITLGTIEEQILGIQRFKLSVARTVINAENTSIQNVRDSNFLGLIDSFAQQNIRPEHTEEEDFTKSLGPYAKYLKELEGAQIWDEDEYQKEYRE